MGYRDHERLGKAGKSELYATLTPLERFFLWLALINFGAFCILWPALRGFAFKAGAHDGHYFLALGRMSTPVSASLFAMNFLHVLSLFITHPLGFVMWRRAKRRAGATNA